MKVYAIGIIHPTRGKIFLRTIQSGEAHVTENREYIRPSALFNTPDQAFAAIGRINSMWVKHKHSKKRDRDLFTAKKIVLEWERPNAVNSDLFVKKMEDY